MTTLIDTKLQELEEELRSLLLRVEEPLWYCEQAIEVTGDVLQKIKDLIVKSGFTNQQQEIHFFKSQKPHFLAKLIYYKEIYNIEIQKPQGNKKLYKKYLKTELEKLYQYFQDNIDFYTYIRSNASHLDHKYFTRNKPDIRLYFNPIYFEADPLFITTHDYKVARIISNDLIQQYLVTKLDALENPSKPTKTENTEVVQNFGISWTASKTDLMEFAFAIFYKKALNNGDVKLNEVMAFVEKAFNVKLGQYHRSFLEMRSRKKGRTPFLEDCQNTLNRIMDQADDRQDNDNRG